jgi:hypothetical protein
MPLEKLRGLAIALDAPVLFEALVEVGDAIGIPYIDGTDG